MRKLSLSILAASIALLPSSAFGQAVPSPAPGVTVQTQQFQRRLQRGFVVPQYFWGPQFQINNWQMYGFANPGPNGRWIRYYDDAYLIDHGGRILDTREGLDWDRYGEQWEVANGIPAYRGSREFHPGPQDYAWAQSHGGQMYAGGQGGQMYYGGQAGAGYGYGSTQVYGGGYGYGAYAYPIVIETVTYGAAAGCCSEEVVEEYVEVRRPRHRARPRCQPTVCRVAPPVRRPPPPRPPAGERG